MSKQIFQKAYISFALTVLGTGLFLLAPAGASANGLIDVVFETGEYPLFNEANFLPGQEITHWVEITNKSGQILPIGVKLISLVNSGSDEYFLANKLQLKIKNGTTILYGPVSLTEFFNAGEVKIADLEADIKATYDFSITFLPGSDDNYQGLGSGFDFQIGVLGTESIGGEITDNSSGGSGGSGGGSGGYFVPGLEIFNEEALVIGDDQVTITWDTSHESTSRVIYSASYEPHTLELDNLPNYGYAHSTAEDIVKVISPHSVTISGLASGTTYYYRAVSHGSFAVSVEHSFTTPGVKIIKEDDRQEFSFIGTGTQTPGGTTNESVSAGSSGETEEEEIALQLPAPFLNEIKNQAEQEETNPGRFMAAIGSLFGSTNLSLILLIFVIILLILSLFLLFKNRKKQED